MHNVKWALGWFNQFDKVKIFIIQFIAGNIVHALVAAVVVAAAAVAAGWHEQPLERQTLNQM